MKITDNIKRIIDILKINNILFQFVSLKYGDWGLGIGDWGLGPIPNPQSPSLLLNLIVI